MTDEEIIRELSAMSVKQIRNIQKRYEKMFPADKHFLTMCTMVIAEKEEQQNRSEFIKLVMEEKQKCPGQCCNTVTGQWNPSTRIKPGFLCIIAEYRQEGKKIMDYKAIMEIMEQEQENQPMASEETQNAYSALDDAINVYAEAVQKDAFYLWLHNSNEADEGGQIDEED